MLFLMPCVNIFCKSLDIKHRFTTDTCRVRHISRATPESKYFRRKTKQRHRTSNPRPTNTLTLEARTLITRPKYWKKNPTNFVHK